MSSESDLSYQMLVQVSIDQETFQRLLRRFLMRFSVLNRNSMLDALETDTISLDRTLSRELVKYGLDGELEATNLASLSMAQEARVVNLTHTFWTKHQSVKYNDLKAVPYFSK